MTALPPVDPERNRELLAERGNWPAGAVDVCRQLEADYPRWMVFWTNGDTPVTPLAGYRAVLQQQGHQADLYAATAEQIRDQVAAVDDEVPLPFEKRPPYRPLV